MASPKKWTDALMRSFLNDYASMKNREALAAKYGIKITSIDNRLVLCRKAIEPNVRVQKKTADDSLPEKRGVAIFKLRIDLRAKNETAEDFVIRAFRAGLGEASTATHSRFTLDGDNTLTADEVRVIRKKCALTHTPSAHRTGVSLHGSAHQSVKLSPEDKKWGDAFQCELEKYEARRRR